MAKGGKILWNELIITVQKKCGEFFTVLPGWERKEVDTGPMGIYTLFQIDGKDVAGMMNPLTKYSKGRPPFWSGYIAMDDIDAPVAQWESVEAFRAATTAMRESGIIPRIDGVKGDP